VKENGRRINWKSGKTWKEVGSLGPKHAPLEMLCGSHVFQKE
jgi:hypothetical protein